MSAARNRLIKLIGVLLDYPGEVLWQYREELLQAAAEPVLAPRRHVQLVRFVDELLALEAMEAQERWLSLFDRGRAMSLLMFEHIHGEARSRGQAMVDLIETYRQNGFEMASRELPDYLPLMLEYLAQRPEAEVQDWLSHTRHILELLAARAAERESPYTLLFELLIELGRHDVDLEVMRKRVASEVRDDSVEMIDQVWEEEAVRFGVEAPGNDCDPPRRLPPGVVPNLDVPNSKRVTP